MSVGVLDQKGRPLMPCTEKRARLLLARGRSRVHRLMPFVIRLVDRTLESCVLQPLRTKRVKGFATGDMVRADVPKRLKAGKHRGRGAVRASGSFNSQTSEAVVQGISHRHCTLVQRADGYAYFFNQDSSTKAGTGRAEHDALSHSGLPPFVAHGPRPGYAQARLRAVACPGNAGVSRAI